VVSLVVLDKEAVFARISSASKEIATPFAERPRTEYFQKVIDGKEHSARVIPCAPSEGETARAKPSGEHNKAFLP